jgi:hypothetical protein
VHYCELLVPFTDSTVSYDFIIIKCIRLEFRIFVAVILGDHNGVMMFTVPQ